MSQNSIIMQSSGTWTGVQASTDITAAVNTVATNFSGGGQPAVMNPNQWWMDTTLNILKVRDNANSAWINTFSFDQTNKLVSGLNIFSNQSAAAAVNFTAGLLASGQAFNVSSSSNSGAASSNSYLCYFSRTGANVGASHSAYGVAVIVANTGTTSTNIAGFFSASGATNNFAVQAPVGTSVFGATSIYTDGTIGTPILQSTAITGSSAGFVTRVASGAVATTMHGFVNSNGTVGTIGTNGTTTSFNTTSDYRIKQDWRPLKKPAMETLSGIPIYTLTFKSEPEKRIIGFLAHELQEFMPEAVTGKKDAVDIDGNPILQMVDSSKIMPCVIAALQEVHIRLSRLEKS
jgi:Chaperone of endosialidase